MSDSIVVAIISGMCVAVPSVMATLKSNNKSSAIMDYKIDELTKKVDKHNSVIERTYTLEEKIKVANHRINKLESKENKGYEH